MKLPSCLQIFKVRRGIIRAETLMIAIHTFIVRTGRCARFVSEVPRRYRARRARPGPAYPALRDFNDPSRRFLSERQAHDPRSRWSHRPTRE